MCLGRRFACLSMAVAIGVTAPGPLFGAQRTAVDLAPFHTMRWRPIGPFRGGMTTAVAGVAGALPVTYAGTAAGGLFRSTDAGRTWQPVFDHEATGAIGAIAIAPSNPRVVYVGTGAPPDLDPPSVGRGLYKSLDGGETWQHLGLPDSVHVPAVIVDPRNADHVLVAASGSTLAAGGERGVFRSTDGGRSFQHVLSTDDWTGALDLAFNPNDASVAYATLFNVRRSPTGDGTQTFGPGTGAFKSTDNGATWRPIMRGLPTTADHGLRRIRTIPAPKDRVFALVDARDGAGLYRSDDGGAFWSLVNDEVRVRAAAAAGSLTADPDTSDGIYVVGPEVMRSTDGGRTFAIWHERTGASVRQLWINPSHSNVAILGSTEGAMVTLNGGATWSTSANQPTGRYASVSTDSAFPYRVCGRERSSAPGCLPSRGARGRITPDDWQAVGAAAGTILPDPQDPDVVLIYAGGLGRFDRQTNQVQDVSPIAAPGEVPRAFAPMTASADGRALYLATNVVWRATTGRSWAAISPPLGPISALAPSAIDNRLIWVGTERGTVHATRDSGLTWSTAGPASLAAGFRVSAVAASHFDTNTAYVSADATSTGDPRPYLWRTRDGGLTWADIGGGLPTDATVTAVREDSFRRGLVFTATTRSLFVSFDDGDSWQSLRLNLPPVPVTDLTIKDADLIIATDGRGFWMLDDISPFRQVTVDVARVDAFLFRPATAWRTQLAGAGATTLDRDDAGAPNPPDGVAISYLTNAGTDPPTIEIIETLTNDVVRRFSNLPATPGWHRVMWDLRHTPIDGHGVWVMPGTYQVRLTAGARVSRQALVVRMDPRVRASVSDLTAQFKLSRGVNERRQRVASARERLADNGADAAAVRAVARELDRVIELLQQSDTRPAPATETTALAVVERADILLADLAGRTPKSDR